MAQNYLLNTEQTYTRLMLLYSKWNSSKDSFIFDAILIQNGKDEAKSIKIKTSAISCWLFGIDLIDSLILFTPKTLYIISTERKIEQLSKLAPKFKNNTPNLQLLSKSPSSNTPLLSQLLTTLQSLSGKGPLKLGLLSKEKQEGPFVEEVNRTLLTQLPHETIDIGTFLIDLYMLKNPSDLNFVRLSGRCACFFGNSLLKELEQAIEGEKRVSHSVLADFPEDLLVKQGREIEEKLGFKVDTLDFTYTPIIQSGGVYDLRLQAESNQKNLAFDTIIWNICVRYMNYNCAVIRTLFINPSKIQKELYESALGVFRRAISALKPGVLVKGLYKGIVEDLKETNALLYEKKPSYFGFGIGLEFKEITLLINEKNENKLEPGMVLFLLFSFNDLKTENQPNPFAIQIADTIIITSLNPEALTAEIPSEFLQISYTIEHKGKSPLRDKQKPLKKSSLKKSSMKKSPNSNSPKTKRNNPSSSTQPLQNPIILTRSRRSQASNTLPKGSSSGNTSSVSQHQKALIELKLDELKARLEADSFDTANKKAKTIPLESLLCYKGVKDLPKDIRVNEIYIDKKAFAVVFPIKTGHFPVHICLIKTVSKYFEQPFLYLRFNFYHYQDKGINKDLVFPIETPDFCFKELIFRSTDQHKLTAVFKTVKDLQKAFKEHEDNEQVPIEVLKGPVLAILKDVKLRPNITGRKTIGHLELKERGFRFVSNKSEVVEIPFNMVKKAIFQPCNDPSDQDYLIILHFHCKSPIKISNNKSFEDIQVFLEAAGTYARDVGKGDSEEDEEKEAAFERKNRMKTNKEFEEFAKATEKESKGKIIFDMPFKELGFLGNPFKAMVMVMPTVSYLVSLVEKPFFLVDLEEIDFACLERIPGPMKNFDLALIHKDWSKGFIRISAIPKEYLEGLQKLLDKMNLIFSDSRLNIRWDDLIQNARKDPASFVEQGGWTALTFDEEEDEDEDDGDSSFDEGELEEDSEEDEDFDEEEEENDEEDEDFDEEDEDLIEDEEFSDEEEEKSKKKKTPAKKRG